MLKCRDWMALTFLSKFLAVRPTPVVICSTLTEKGAETSLQALSAGIFIKPKAGLKSFLEDDSGDIVQVVKAAALTDMRRMKAMTMEASRNYRDFNRRNSSVGIGFVSAISCLSRDCDCATHAGKVHRRFCESFG